MLRDHLKWGQGGRAEGADQCSGGGATGTKVKEDVAAESAGQ
jgi:hypothetical protein